MEPISQKVASATAKQAASEAKKSTPSQFDLLRSDLNQKLSSGIPLPAKVTTVDAQQKLRLENDLRQKLAAGANPAELATGTLQRLQTSVTNLSQKVNALPKSDPFAPLRNRLQSVEADFNRSSQLLQNPGDLNNPKQLLAMQMEMYKVSQNVEILSRVVSDVASGVKTLVQTQV
jgi:type III secretion system YscI/HrpB-like protein